VGALERRLAEQDAVVGDDADLVTEDPGEAADQGVAVELLELVEAAAVDHAADDLAHVVRRAGVGRHDVIDRVGRLVRLLDGSGLHPTTVLLDRRQGLDHAAHDRERVGVVVGEVVDHPGRAGMDVAAAEVLGRDDLAGRGLHQRRAAEEDGALVAHDDRLVRHRRDVRPARRA